MKEAIFELVTSYKAFFGTSKILLLFAVALLLICYMNSNDDTKRRRIIPAVFLLSLWSMVAYAFTLMLKKSKWRDLIVVLLAITSAYLTGGFVFTDEFMHYSIYFYTHYVITIAGIAAIISFFTIYYLISRELFEDKYEQLMFMIFAVILHLFAGYSIEFVSVSLLLYPLSVGSLVIHDFMPFILWIYLMYERTHDNIDTEETEDYENYEEEWDLKKHKFLNMRNMLIAFAVFFIAFIACVFVLNSKINNLYNATLNLQKATEDKISVFEFKENDTDEAYAKLMILGDGSCTLIGGAGAEQDLYDFVINYTNEIDEWYLYDNDKADITSYNYLTSKGINVKKSYFITGVEEVK